MDRRSVPAFLPAGHAQRWALQAAGVDDPVELPASGSADAGVRAPDVSGLALDRGRVAVDPFGRLRPPRPQWSPTTTVLAYVPSQRSQVSAPGARQAPARPAVLGAGVVAVAGLLVARVAGLV